MLLEDKTFLKSMKKSIKESFLLPALFLLFACILIINQEHFLSMAVSIFGYGAIFLGILNLFFYFRTDEKLRIFNRQIFQSVILVSFGIITFFQSSLIENMIYFFLGTYYLFQSANRIELSVNLKSFTEKFWFISLLISFVQTIISLLLIVNPFSHIKNLLPILLSVVSMIFLIQNIVLLIGLREKKEK